MQICHPWLRVSRMLVPIRKDALVAKKPANAGARWTSAQDNQLRREAQQNTPTRVIGLHLGRSEDAVRNRASQLGFSLKPTNQSPYGTRKKK